MRFVFASSMLFLLPLLAGAQQPAANQAQLVAVLQQWEQAMARLDSFAVTCKRTTTDRTFGSIEVFEGSAKFLKGVQGQPSRALLEMAKKGEPAKFEKFLYTGLALYEWVPATKVLRVHRQPTPKPGEPLIDANIVTLLFGMTANAAQRRYEMRWVPDTKDNNKFYQYVQVLPREPADKADFTEARLVLTARDFLPRQVWYHQPNGNEVTWDFEALRKNGDARVNATTFAPPQYAPAGWRVDQVQPQAPPPGELRPSMELKKQ